MLIYNEGSELSRAQIRRAAALGGCIEAVSELFGLGGAIRFSMMLGWEGEGEGAKW